MFFKKFRNYDGLKFFPDFDWILEKEEKFTNSEETEDFKQNSNGRTAK